MSIKLSIGDHKRDVFPKDITINLTQLTSILTTFPASISEKGDGKYIVSGHFNGNPRKTENLQQKTLLSLDVDFYDRDLTSLEHDFKAKFNGLWYNAYSTSSHTPNKPRIRIVLLLSREITPDEYRAVAKNFIISLGDFKRYIEFNSSCMPNNAMFLPIRTSNEYIPWYDIQDGAAVDVEKFNFAQVKKKAAKKVNLSDGDIKGFLAKYDATTCDYDGWLKVGMGLHHQYDGSDIGYNMWLEWSLSDKDIKGKNRYNGNSVESVCKYKYSTFTSSSSSLSFASIISVINNAHDKSVGDDVVVFRDKEGKHLYDLKFTYVPICDWVQTKGKDFTPIMCMENFEILLNHYKLKIRYDLIAKEEVIDFDGSSQGNLNTAITRIKSLAVRNNFPYQLIDSFATAIADENEFNPWDDWVRSKPWDGVDRFNEFCETVQVVPENIKLRNMYLKAWLLQLMHLTCLNDGLFPKMGRYVLVFQSIQQEMGKTTWFKCLVPPDKINFVGEGKSLNTHDNMNVKECTSKVMVELGEISSTFKKSDIDSLKNFITKSTDEINMKYERRHLKSRRRTVYFANANETQFLHDKTGNSRFLALQILSCNAFHGIDHQQLYAQMLQLAIHTPSYELTKEQALLRNEANKTYETISVIQEKFEDIYDVDNKDTSSYQKATATKVLENLGFQVSNMKHYQNELAKILDSAGYSRCTHPRGWLMPPLKKKDGLM